MMKLLFFKIPSFFLSLLLSFSLFLYFLSFFSSSFRVLNFYILSVFSILGASRAFPHLSGVIACAAIEGRANVDFIEDPFAIAEAEAIFKVGGEANRIK
jgi:hypothetical protein